MKRVRIILMTTLMLSVMLLIGLQAVFAEEPAFSIDNTRLVTNDRDATYIEGSVSEACGQTIIVKHALFTVAKKTLPNTGRSETFRIKVPAKSISDKRMMVFNVKMKNADGSSETENERVEISYVERKDQEIRLADNDYKMTFPGLDTEINAEASSGEGLTFSSSDPDIVSVDENGVLQAKGEGAATITVRQIGNGKYKEAEKDVKVSVEGIDAYTVTFHSSDDENAETKQIIMNGSDEELAELSFENGEAGFLGWATSDEGLVEYDNAEQVRDLAEPGENVDMYAVWEGDGVRAAIAWAIKIANDDSFSYGKKPQTSKVGCYFCGTNCGPVKHNKPKGYEKTYVCLTFVHAAYAHGCGDPEMYADCSKGRRCITANNLNFSRYSCWKKVGNAKNLSVGDLEPGDVIVTFSSDGVSNGHVAMYVGGNQIVDAEGIKDCWGPNSIAVRDKASSALRGAARHSGNSYVMRYNGPVGANG